MRESHCSWRSFDTCHCGMMWEKPPLTPLWRALSWSLQEGPRWRRSTDPIMCLCYKCSFSSMISKTKGYSMVSPISCSNSNFVDLLFIPQAIWKGLATLNRLILSDYCHLPLRHSSVLLCSLWRWGQVHWALSAETYLTVSHPLQIPFLLSFENRWSLALYYCCTIHCQRARPDRATSHL